MTQGIEHLARLGRRTQRRAPIALSLAAATSTMLVIQLGVSTVAMRRLVRLPSGEVTQRSGGFDVPHWAFAVAVSGAALALMTLVAVLAWAKSAIDAANVAGVTSTPGWIVWLAPIGPTGIIIVPFVVLIAVRAGRIDCEELDQEVPAAWLTWLGMWIGSASLGAAGILVVASDGPGPTVSTLVLASGALQLGAYLLLFAMIRSATEGVGAWTRALEYDRS